MGKNIEAAVCTNVSESAGGQYIDGLWLMANATAYSTSVVLMKSLLLHRPVLPQELILEHMHAHTVTHSQSKK